MKPRFSPSCNRSCVKMADRFASRRYSLKNKLVDRMIKQLLNSVIAKYRDLSVSRRSIIFRSQRLRQIIGLLAIYKSRYFAQPRPIIASCSSTVLPSNECLFVFVSKDVSQVSSNRKPSKEWATLRLFRVLNWVVVGLSWQGMDSPVSQSQFAAFNPIRTSRIQWIPLSNISAVPEKIRTLLTAGNGNSEWKGVVQRGAISEE